MSMMDIMDDALLGDDDELDYDLEKDEEDALLADPVDNYDENYENADNQNENFDDPVNNEEESDILDIDSNVHLDENEEDIVFTGEQNDVKQEQSFMKQDVEETSDQEDTKQRNRFQNERNNSVRTTNHEIPDTLDKVEVTPLRVNTVNQQRNGKFQRGGRGRGRGRQNHQNRGSVFGRVGVPQKEVKKVLINPHFRGNVRVNENARLCWDANVQVNNPNYQSQRYSAPQTAQVAPFHQTQFPVDQLAPPQPWITAPYNNEQNPNPVNNYSLPHGNNNQMPPNFQEPPMQFNQPPPNHSDIVNTGIRPLMSLNQPPPQQFLQQQQPPPQMANWMEDQNQNYNCEGIYPSQGNFRGRDARFNNPPNVQPLVIQPFENPTMKNQRRFINQNVENGPLVQQLQQNYPPNQPNTFDQPFMNQNQFHPNQMNSPQPTPFQSQQQTFINQPPLYDQYNNQNQFNNPNLYSGPSNQFSIPPQNNQNFGSPQQHNFPPQNNYENNFNSNQEQFVGQSYNNRHQFNNNRNNQRQNRHNFTSNINNANRSPPKRRSFENQAHQGTSDRDLHKKKKRSMELSNLHEVPTVDMSQPAVEVKIEDEDEETRAYRLQIEEQKKLREKILREKEERRKLAAAQKLEGSEPTPDHPPTPGTSLLSTLKTKINIPQQQSVNTFVQPVQTIGQQSNPQQGKKFINKQQQNNANRMQQRRIQQQKMQQRKFQNSNIQINTTIQHMQQQQQQQQQRRIVQQNRIINNPNQTNIIVSQKQQVPQNQQQQRIVLMKNNNNNTSATMLNNTAKPTNLNNRRVVLKGMNSTEITAAVSDTASTSSTSSESSNFNSFLSNRKVISSNSVVTTTGKNCVDLGQALIQTPIVVVSNLAVATTDVTIRKLCQGLGPIQNIQMIPNSRQATIRFKNIISAHKFFKKYQRKIIDLSMIQVSLEAIS